MSLHAVHVEDEGGRCMSRSYCPDYRWGKKDWKAKGVRREIRCSGFDHRQYGPIRILMDLSARQYGSITKRRRL